MEETPNTQTPEEEEVETPEATPQSPETPEEGAGQEGKPGKTTSAGKEPSPEERVKELERDYSASSKEAKRLAEENKLLKVQLEGNTSGATPSDEELAKIVPDWDILSPTEQYLWREQVMLKRQVAQVSRTVSQTTRQQNWENLFSELVKNPDFTSIAERRSEFKEFCEGVEPTDKLAKAFLFEDAKTIGAQEEREKLNRKGLERKSGGTKEPPKEGLTEEEKAEMRKNQPEKFKRLVKQGKIKV